MIDINEKYKKILKDIFKKYPYKFYAFGSRAKNINRKFSDLDICYKEQIPMKDLSLIREALENSNLPFMVDLVYWDDMPDSFKILIEKDLSPIC